VATRRSAVNRRQPRSRSLQGERVRDLRVPIGVVGSGTSLGLSEPTGISSGGNWTVDIEKTWDSWSACSRRSQWIFGSVSEGGRELTGVTTSLRRARARGKEAI